MVVPGTARHRIEAAEAKEEVRRGQLAEAALVNQEVVLTAQARTIREQGLRVAELDGEVGRLRGRIADRGGAQVPMYALMNEEEPEPRRAVGEAARSQAFVRGGSRVNLGGGLTGLREKVVQTDNSGALATGSRWRRPEGTRSSGS